MSTRLLAIALCSAGCAGVPAWKGVPHDRQYQVAAPPLLHPRPAKRIASRWWDTFVYSTSRPIGDALNPGHHLSRLSGGFEALDINTFGQVPDSAWFTNRIGRGGFDPARLARGPDRLTGPAPGPLTVISGKTAGVQPGFVVRDSAGATFVVKFDHPAFPELATGAEIISTKLMYAAGYNVPENYLVELDLELLELAPDATTKGEYGEELPFDEETFRAVLGSVNPREGRWVRAIFSRFIPGKIIGPFQYRGVDLHDPNDQIPHERRRTLRGYGVFAAWINNTDVRPSNTLDAFMPVAGSDLGYVVHYLFDFGTTLGSRGGEPKYIGQGHVGFIDWPEIAIALFTFGVPYPRWLLTRRSPYRGAGTFESELFDPGGWQPMLQNPAFEEITPLDDYWAASIIARFTPEHLLSAVRTARYSEDGATEYVLRVLTERQYAILEHAFARVLPLEDPHVDGTVLSMTDLAVSTNLLSEDQVRYEYEVRWARDEGPEVILERGARSVASIELAPSVAVARAFGPAFDADPFFTVRWSRSEARDGPAAEVHLRVDRQGLLPVGITR